MNSISLIAGGAIIIQITAIYCIWKAITSARTPQSSIGWSIFLISAPVIAVPAYLFFGHHRYRGYEISRRSSERVIRGVEYQQIEHPMASKPALDPTALEKIADFRAVGGNAFRILIDGQETFEAIFAAIDQAKNYVLVQFFIVHDDEIGRDLQRHLISAAERGVKVRFLVDPVGSHGLSKDYTSLLRKAGVEVAARARGNRPRHRFQINFRNHRKTVVVDGQTGFVGGHNVGDEYLGRSEEFGPWRDTHLEMRGPVVAQAQLIFAEDWHWVIGTDLIDELHWSPEAQPENRSGLVVPTGPGDVLDTGTLFFFNAIAAAQDRVWIASPYLVPDQEVLVALKHAALLGRDVRLIVPDAVDHWLPWLASFAYYTELLRAGVRIFRYKEGFMHQKVVLVDHGFAAIGTSNLDNRSFRLNFEMMVTVLDEAIAAQTEEFLKRDMARSFEVKTAFEGRSLAIRVGSHIARLFAPLL